MIASAKIAVRQRDLDGTGLYVHARLLMRRNGQWHVCGVFQLDRSEWQLVAEVLAAQGIEVIDDKAFPPDTRTHPTF